MKLPILLPITPKMAGQTHQKPLVFMVFYDAREMLPLK